MSMYFERVEEKEYSKFRQDVKDIFSIAVIEEFGDSCDGDVIPDEDINESLLNPNAEAYYIYAEIRRLAGLY